MNGAKRIEYAQTKPNMTIYDQTHTHTRYYIIEEEMKMSAKEKKKTKCKFEFKKMLNNGIILKQNMDKFS